ncbi:hypothetical protein DL93DRAFT_2200750 [Clavulina sp. PMI_390]|nr:hypothetical protein DL93DRAFT_2200750 [Clavulina sp. PMI_390]
MPSQDSCAFTFGKDVVLSSIISSVSGLSLCVAIMRARFSGGLIGVTYAFICQTWLPMLGTTY